MTRITGKTAILLMLADPVSHIRGSAIINDNLAKLGLDAAIVPVHVPPADLGVILDAVRRMRNVAGLGITIPHKISVLPLVDEATDVARRIGAVNFVRRNADGTLTGHNIDGEGFVAGLAAHGYVPAGKRVLVVGAGGVGRAIAFALADAGVTRLGIANRSADKASALAAQIAALVPGCQVEAVDLDDTSALVDLDLLVNATSIGTKEGDELPIALDRLSAATCVAEVVVNPPMTPLLRAAAARGCAIVTGDAMLQPQPNLMAAFLDLGPASPAPNA